jgi:hypothetical protein
MPELLLVNNSANSFGLFTPDSKGLPTARFLPLAALLFDEEHLEDVSCSCRMGRNSHEASLFLTPNQETGVEKGRLVVDNTGVAKQLL